MVFGLLANEVAAACGSLSSPVLMLKRRPLRLNFAGWCKNRRTEKALSRGSMSRWLFPSGRAKPAMIFSSNLPSEAPPATQVRSRLCAVVERTLAQGNSFLRARLQPSGRKRRTGVGIPSNPCNMAPLVKPLLTHPFKRPRQTATEYHAPFFKSDPEESHRVAWTIFQQD